MRTIKRAGEMPKGKGGYLLSFAVVLQPNIRSFCLKSFVCCFRFWERFYKQKSCEPRNNSINKRYSHKDGECINCAKPQLQLKKHLKAQYGYFVFWLKRGTPETP